MKTKSRAKLFLSVVVASLGLFVLGANSVSADSSPVVSQSQTSEKQMGKIVIRYVDQFGDEVYPSETLEQAVGNVFHVASAISPLDDATIQSPAEYPKTFTSQTQYVVYTYIRQLNAGAITVQFQDEEGNKLAQNSVVRGYVGQAFPWFIREAYINHSAGKYIVGDTSPFSDAPRTVTVVYQTKINNSTSNTSTASQATSQAKDVQTVQSDLSKNNSAVLPNTNTPNNSKVYAALTSAALIIVMIAIFIFMKLLPARKN